MVANIKLPTIYIFLFKLKIIYKIYFSEKQKNVSYLILNNKNINLLVKISEVFFTKGKIYLVF